MAPLTSLSYIQKSCAGVMFVLGTTNMDPQGNCSLAGANVCASPDLQKPTLWVDVHPNNTLTICAQTSFTLPM